jgi:hypothetical protein
MDFTKFAMWPLALIIAGCSAHEAPAPAPPAKSVFDPLTQDLEKAKAVQGTVDESALKERKSLEAQERGDSP